MTTRTDVLAVVALLVLAALAGCSGMGGAGDGASTGGSGGGAGDSAPAGESDGERAADRQAGETSGEGSGAVAAERALVRTGTVTLGVADYGEARANLTDAAARRGGFVTDSEQRVREVDNETYTTGSVTFRVPAENVSAFFARARAAGEVRTAETNTEDATERLIDLEARLENKRAQRDRLRSLYEDANETEEVLAVGEKLSAVQGDVERLAAERRALRDRVAYATVTVELREPRPEPSVEAALHETGVVPAFLASVGGVVRLTRTLVVGLAYALPYVLAFGLPLAGMAVLYRRLR